MNTRGIFLFLSACLILAGCAKAKKQDHSFILEGKISGQDTGRIILTYNSDSPVSDTARIKNGEFVFRGELQEPVSASINAGNDLVIEDIYIEPANMKLELNNNPKGYKLTGSKTQDENGILALMQDSILRVKQSYQEKYDKNMALLNNTNDEEKRKLLENENEEIGGQVIKCLRECDKVYYQFIKKYPKSYISGYLLYSLASKDFLQFDTLKAAYQRLDTTVQMSRMGGRVSTYIKQKERILTGSFAPDFKATDLNQKTITMNQYRNRSVVLLDFWASYCGPCRGQIPEMKALYKKYHAKGFEIIAVTTESTRDQWIKAVNDEGIQMWVNIPVAVELLPGKITEDDLYDKYYTSGQGIPLRYLIGKDGKILAKWGGGIDDTPETLEEILKGIFI